MPEMRRLTLSISLVILLPDALNPYPSSSSGVQQRSLSKVEKESRKKAYEIDTIELFDRIEGDIGFISVQATDGKSWYKVSYDLRSCSCPAYCSTGLACKHIFMASRYMGRPVKSGSFELAAASTEEHTAPTLSATAATVEAEARIRQEKHYLIKETLDEVARLSRAVEKAMKRPTFASVNSREELQQLAAEVVSARRLAESLK
ncbi:hypothetical protein V8E36_006189 [Tilletia maclaganii]